VRSQAKGNSIPGEAAKYPGEPVHIHHIAWFIIPASAPLLSRFIYLLRIQVNQSRCQHIYSANDQRSIIELMSDGRGHLIVTSRWSDSHRFPSLLLFNILGYLAAFSPYVCPMFYTISGKAGLSVPCLC
jgi:hypothetical protein